jgi:hypothetical protein
LSTITGNAVTATTTVSGADGDFTDDIFADDDITCTGTLAAGNITAGSTIAATTTISAADGVLSDDLFVTGDTTTTGTITSGSTVQGANVTATSAVTGDTVAATTTVTAADGIITDDLFVTGDTVTTGSITSAGAVQGATVVATDSVTAADVIVTDDLFVTGDTTTTGTITSAGAVQGATVTATGALTGLKTVITVTTDTALSAEQCRDTVVYLAAAQGDTTITVTMPTLVAGYRVQFVDNDLTAGADLKIQMASGDVINGGTAAKAYTHGNGTTAVGSATFTAVDETDFVLDGTPTDSGNWANNDS